jgi:DNA ligase-1
LYGHDSHKRIKQWRISVADLDGVGATITTEHGLKGGQLQTAERLVRVGKNVGRANETTPLEQAKSEAASKWRKQFDKNYVTDPRKLHDASDLHHVPHPMLAKPYAKRGKKWSWPAYVQPKLNGIRMLAKVGDDEDVTYWSRNRKPITTVDHLTMWLSLAFEPGTVVDGELFHPFMSLQDIVSAAKKKGPNTPRLQYWIYDLADVRYPFAQRRALYRVPLDEHEAHSPLVSVPCPYVVDEESMMALHSGWVEKYEGTIIRSSMSFYKPGPSRSDGLLKHKNFMDEEFEIVGYKDGEGKERGLIIFECATKEGKTFFVRPRGTAKQRAFWYDEGHALVGEQLTVRFSEWTPDKIPFHPVGLAIRDYE